MKEVRTTQRVILGVAGLGAVILILYKLYKRRERISVFCKFCKSRLSRYIDDKPTIATVEAPPVPPARAECNDSNSAAISETLTIPDEDDDQEPGDTAPKERVILASQSAPSDLKVNVDSSQLEHATMAIGTGITIYNNRFICNPDVDQ